MEPIKLVVVDDHALFRAGLISLLQDFPEVKILGEASNGKEALQVIRQKKPDVVLLDINMPLMTGVEVVKELSRAKGRPDCRIIMLTISRHEEDLFGAIAAGADGYLLKNAEPEELRQAILRVASGQSVLAPEVTQPVMRAVAKTSLGAIGISKREIEVLECLAHGMTTTQIAEELFVSENTIKTHIRHILEKLEASNRAEAVSKATQLGLIRA